ncbi:MAG: DUF1460 domain-containing protein [Bacteroidia bacterium]|nr:DUF1460 domain-containing protein [Bacteroidia bacterium]
MIHFLYSKKVVLLIFLSFTGLYLAIRSQNNKQEEIFKKKIELCQTESVSDCVIEYGTSFIEVPYVSHTLEENETEQLVVNLDKFDCATYVESVLAMAIVSVRDKNQYDKFAEMLQKLRYHGGVIDGYASRIHYFSDWLYENTQNGILENVTARIGGEAYQKPVSFMSSNPKLYKHLAGNPDAQEKIRQTEQQMNERKMFYIPKEKVKSVEPEIQEGDIIGITTSVKGLDISHEGFAIKRKGRIHLMHASSDEKKVVISAQPLAEYLMSHKSQTGIMVCRANNPL